MGFHRSNILITHLITLTMQILSVYVLHTTTTTVYDLSGTCIILQAGLWKRRKKFPRLWKRLEKSPSFRIPLNKELKNSGANFQTLEVLPQQCFQCNMWKQRLDNNCAVHKSRRAFKSVSCFAKLEATIIAHQEVNSWQMMQ